MSRIRWKRAEGGHGYFAAITEGGLVTCTLVVVKRRLPFHRPTGIVVLERWTVSILEPDGRPRLDVPAGAFTSLAAAKEAAAGELSRIARAGLTEAQDDGRACVRCGLEGLPMLPTGKRGSHGAQLFECERHGRRGAT